GSIVDIEVASVYDRTRPGQRHHDAVADVDVVAGGVPNGIGEPGTDGPADLAGAPAAEDQVVAGAADDDVVAVGERRRGGEHVFFVGDPPDVGEDDVVAAARVDHVVATLAEDEVVAGAGGDRVVAEAALDVGGARVGIEDDGVVAGPTLDLVGDGGIRDARQVDHVVALAAQNEDRAAAQLVLLRHGLRDAEARRPHAHVMRIAALLHEKLL